MGNKYVARNVLSQGDGAHIHDVRWNQVWKNQRSVIDLDILASQLALLRVELKKVATEPSHDVAVGAVASAQELAAQHSGQKALERLAGAGKWCLDVARKVSLDVAVKAIEISLKANGVLP